MADSKTRIARREKVPIPVQDYCSVDEIAALLRISRNRVYDLAKGREDPLPLRCDGDRDRLRRHGGPLLDGHARRLRVLRGGGQRGSD